MIIKSCWIICVGMQICIVELLQLQNFSNKVTTNELLNILQNL